MFKTWRHRIAALVLLGAMAGGVAMEGAAQDAVWNLRTPEWKEAWTLLPAEGEPDLALIRIASQLAGYSGSFLPVAPVAPGVTAGLEPGQVPVDLAWFAAPPGILAFGLADGWAHQLQDHITLAEPGSSLDVAAWMAGVRYSREDARQADAWAARFMAEFGYPVEPLFAQLCQRGQGERVAAIADAYEAVVGWRPDAPCGPLPAVVELAALLLSCDQTFDACRADAEQASQACNGACYADKCALACSGGSYEQCNTCQASCSRACNSSAASLWGACDDDLALCEAGD